MDFRAKAWPAAKFRELLAYKAEEHGITVADIPAVTTDPGQRAVEAELRRRSARVKRRRDALREIAYQLKQL
jgi:hypothetical protein